MIKVCFTGHRPDAEGMGGYDLYTERNTLIMDMTYKLLLAMYKKYRNDKYDRHFIYAIVGGALGYDELALNACKELKDSIDIEIELAVPFENWKSAWPQHAVKRYTAYQQNVDKITYVDTLDKYKYDRVPIGNYAPAKMQLRNKYMVDNADIVIACWNGNEKGGTYNCITYAKKMKKNLVIIDPNTLKIGFYFQQK